jgi:mono/diheme cytochrome c family protein
LAPIRVEGRFAWGLLGAPASDQLQDSLRAHKDIRWSNTTESKGAMRRPRCGYVSLILLNRSSENREKMIRAIALASILTASAFATNAQEVSGDAETGRVYAREVCSPCHAVTAEQASQRLIAIAPDFQHIANTPGMTATALRAFLQTPHPKMPDLILKPEQTADVIAFLLSLRDRRQPETKP